MLPVSFVASSDCFLRLPKGFADAQGGGGGVKGAFEVVEPGGGRLYAGWTGVLASGSVVEIPVELARCAQFPQSVTHVTLTPVEAKDAAELHVEPVSADDSEVVDMHAAVIERELLQQVNVVYPQQVFPFRIHNTTLVRMRVLSALGGAPCARLRTHSEVHVVPVARVVPNVTPPEWPPVNLKILPTAWLPLDARLVAGAHPAHATDTHARVHPTTLRAMAGFQEPGPGRHRAHVAKLCAGDVSLFVGVEEDGDVPPGVAAVPRLLLAGAGAQGADSATLTLVQLGSDRRGAAAQPAEPPTMSLAQIVWRIRDCGDDGDAGDNTYAVPSFLAVGVKPPRDVPQILAPEAALLAGVRQWLSDHPHTPLTSGQCVPVSVAVPPDSAAVVDIKVGFEGGDGGFLTYADTWMVVGLPGGVTPPQPPLPAVVGPAVVLEASPAWAAAPPVVAGVEAAAEATEAALLSLLRPQSIADAGQVLGACLTGPSGCGKSSLAAAVCHRLAAAACGVVWVDCAALLHRRLEDVKDALRGAWASAKQRAPAVLVLDGAQHLMPKPSDGPEAGSPADQQAWVLAEVFAEAAGGCRVERRAACDRAAAQLDALTSTPPDEAMQPTVEALAAATVASASVACLLTCPSLDGLQPVVSAPSLWHPVSSLASPDAAARCAMLAALASRHTEATFDVDWGQVSAACDGFNAGDCVAVVQRAVHGHTAGSLVTTEATMAALADFVPASLRGVKLFRSDVAWDDVGGLDAAKRVLKETLEFPVRFAPLYARCPLRMPSGVLLYGPPGCGKTLLAAAVARECGLRFISVKGPEILDKYIGASEEAVRELFAQAAAAAPSILFFDELDAVAPRRGSGSTGVTDRVVNQLLTFLDGVESCEGVYVLGASSRPDMIDTALLRPGRLDKHVYCGFPSAGERGSILQAVTRNMALSVEVQACLGAIAACAECQRFTGADLQALMYSAQLAAAKDAMAGSGTGDAVVDLPHVQAALATTPASVSASECARLVALYDGFRSGRVAAGGQHPPRVALQ